MDIEFINEKENPLLDRTEYDVRIIHAEGTPKFGEMRSKIAALKDLDNDKFVLQGVKALYGMSTSVAELRIYKDSAKMAATEHDYVLKKNGLIKEGGDADGQ
jgi:ribosomal protein S24E